MISKKRLLTIVSLLIVVAFLNTGMFGVLSDTERSLNNSVTAYTPKMWKSTTEFDFDNNTTQVNVVVHTSPGNVSLADKITAQTSLYALTGNGLKNFYRYFISTDTWVKMNDTLENVGWGGSMAYDQVRYIYALAGGGTDAFMRYDVVTGKWSTLNKAPGPVTSGSFLSNYVDGMLYALQGARTGVMWKYNPATEVWTTLTTNLPKTTEADDTKNAASMIGYGGFMYIIRSDKGGANTFIKMSLTSPYAWTALNPTPTSVTVGASITQGQGTYLYAAPGGNKNVYEYNIALGTWKKLQGNTGNNLKAGSDLAFDGTSLYVTRGDNQKNIWKYDGKKWQPKTNVPVNVNYGGNLLFVPNAYEYSSNGTLDSKVYDTTSAQSVFNSIFADKTLPVNTGLTFWVRAANTRTWIPTPDDPNNGTDLNGTWEITGTWIKVTASMPAVIGKYMQWRVELTTTNSGVTPILHEVRFYYRRG